MLADDEEVVRIVAAEALTSVGYEVEVAEDGRRAVELFDRFEAQWGVVILDLIMPHLNGNRVFEHIHARRPDLPVVLASGFSAEEITERFEGRPVAAFLHKPYTCETLVELVSGVLGSQSLDVS